MSNEMLAETFHPGVFLEEELMARGWGRVDLAEILGKPANDISLIITGKRSITPEMAVRLGEAFTGTGAEYWWNLEAAYQLAQAEQSKGEIAERAVLYERYPVREMIKRGWINATQNIHNLKEQFHQFYGNSVEQGFQFYHAPRKSTPYSEDNNMYQDAWLARARNMSPGAPVSAKFSQARLKTCIAKLKNLMHEPNEIRHVPKILAEAGIRLIVIETLPKTKIDGATFWLGDKKDEPVIVLSLRYDRIDNFWFTLFHELSHVENGDGKTAPVVDENLMGEDTLDKPESERQADADAAKACADPAELESFINRTHPYYLEWKIQGFASLLNVHPGIVVGQLQHRYTTTGRGLPHSHLRKLLVKVRHIITEATTTDGFGYIPSK